MAVLDTRPPSGSVNTSIRTIIVPESALALIRDLSKYLNLARGQIRTAGSAHGMSAPGMDGIWRQRPHEITPGAGL
jgi:hypothetical protein